MWLKEITRIREGGGELGGRWFEEHVSKKVGTSQLLFFFVDWSLNEWDSFVQMVWAPFLFGGDQTAYGDWADVFARVGTDREAWEWRRQLRVWEEEEMLEECQSLLINLSLQAQSSDRWQWQPDPDKSYIVRGAYQLLISHVSASLDDAENLIWHPQVLLKVSIFALCLLRDRLPTKANLVTRGILSPVAHFCVSGCGAVESAQHLFISCSIFGFPFGH
jgi:hypothetical protein